MIKLGEKLPHLAKKRVKLTFDDMAEKDFEDKSYTTKELMWLHLFILRTFSNSEIKYQYE